MFHALALAVLALQAPAAAQATPAPRVEAFVLEQVDPLAAGDLWTLLGAPPRTPYGEVATPPEEVGFLLWRRSVDEGGITLEWDLCFHESETRVLEIERREAQATHLVYREMQPRSGRTLRADWIDEGSTLRLREWGGRNGQQLRLEDCAGGRFRLGLLEELREASELPSSMRVFDPLSRRFEHLTVSVEAGAPDGPWAAGRLLRLTRDNGSSAGAWLVRDGVPVAFQWQSGGLRARRIDLAEYERRLEQLEAQRAAAEKAASEAPEVEGGAGAE